MCPHVTFRCVSWLISCAGNTPYHTYWAAYFISALSIKNIHSCPSIYLFQSHSPRDTSSTSRLFPLMICQKSLDCMTMPTSPLLRMRPTHCLLQLSSFSQRLQLQEDKAGRRFVNLFCTAGKRGLTNKRPYTRSSVRSQSLAKRCFQWQIAEVYDRHSCWTWLKNYAMKLFNMTCIIFQCSVFTVPLKCSPWS